MVEPKIPVIGAVVGFVLSFLIGLISGAAFHLILLRALGMGLLFGVIAVACSALVKKYLPELLSEESVDEGRDPAMGTVVDVTLGDAPDAIPSFDGEVGERLPDFATPGEAKGWRNEDSPTDVEDLSPGEFVPGLSVGGAFARASGSGREAGNGADKSSPTAKGAHAGSAMPVTADGLDILPDLQDFVPAARQETDERPEDIDTGFSGQTAGSGTDERASRDFHGSDVESATMVKAIRTLLSRDN